MPETRFRDIRWFDSLDSTNRYLLDEARSGAAEGVVAVADHQVAGRGRLGRRWEAPPGANLLVSVLLRPDLPVPDRHLASAVVALAAVDAIAAEAGYVPGIKWPNDLLGNDGRKLAGILAEADLDLDLDVEDEPTAGGQTADPGDPPGSGGLPARHPAIVVGIGINVGWPRSDDDLPDDLRGVATSLVQETGRAVDRQGLLDALLAALEPRVAALASARGRAQQAQDLRDGCTTIGSRVRVELAGSSFDGMAVDLTAEGHLVVDSAEGQRTVVAGDVVHLRPAP